MMAENVENLFQPNKDLIKEHLEFLFGGETDGLVEIAYTPPNSGAVNKAEFFKVTDLQKAADFAVKQNAIEGVNVYVGAAVRKPETPLFGRSDASDYMSSSVVWVDLDEADAARLAKDKYKTLPPSFVVITGRSPDLRAQAWWKLSEPCSDPAILRASLAQLCAYFDGDKAVVDPARVMRLGGSVAWPKKDKRVIELTETRVPENATKGTNFNSLGLAFPVQEKTPEPQKTLNISNTASLNLGRNESGWTIEQVCDMLSHIHPDNEYMDWVSVGMALKDYGVSFDIFDAWSSTGAKYEGSREARYKWDSFKGSGKGIGTLYYIAHNAGYHPSNYRKNEIKTAPSYSKEFKDEQTGVVSVEIAAPKNGKTLPLIYADDIEAITETTDFVEDLLRDEEFSVIYGQSNCGKTFFMLDLAMHVALGLEWRGKHVEQGGVVYAALEGGHGTKNRIAAFKQENGILEGIPMAVIPSAVNFLDEESDMPALIRAVLEAKEKLGRVRLIVVDTLARAISGGDENSSSEMGALIMNADALRKATGAHVCFIHHSGKDDLKGARGHSSLRAAVDTEIEISRPDTESPSTIKVVKQREMEMIEDMAFSLKRVVLGENKRGKEVTSCVVVPCENVVKEKPEKLSPVQKFVYESIVQAVLDYGQVRNVAKDMPPVNCIRYDELRIVMESRGGKEFFATEKKTTAEQIKSSTFNARAALKNKEKINMTGGYIWLV